MKHLDYTTLKEWIASGKKFQLIDVREPEEHAAHNIGGLLIPLAEVVQSAQKIAMDRPVVFYCKRGIRSQIAIQKLQRVYPEGEFYNLAHGLLMITR